MQHLKFIQTNNLKKLINYRKTILLELKETTRELKNLISEKEKIDELYFSGKIGFLEYQKHKETFNKKKNSLKILFDNLKKHLLEIQEIDRKIVNEIVKLKIETKSGIKLKSVSKFKKTDKKSFLDKVLEKINLIKEYTKDPRKYLESLLKNIFKSEVKIVDEKILAAYNEILQEYLKNTKIKEETPKLSLKTESIDDLVFKGSTDFSNLSLIQKIKLWYIKKFKLKKFLEENKGKKENIKTKKSWFNRFVEKYIVGEKTKTKSIKSLIQLKQVHETAKSRKSKLSFEEEVKALKSLLNIQKEKEKFEETEIYVPNIYGIISNVLVKNIGLWLINQFPNFFRKLYVNLQIANMRVLSSTYINMMILSSFISGFLFFLWVVLIGRILHLPLIIAISIGWFFLLFGALGTFLLFYFYPQLKISRRRQSIKTNLPFAIIHMSAIAGSGLTPLKMFELIAKGNEFGEVSEEFKKIVKYVNLFGVDLITAIKTAIETNPSPEMKDFLNGLITSIESGGDIILYLTVKAEEILNLYKLEREKVNDNISIFSEIYMGVMITAPMFFILITSIIGFIGGGFMGLSAKFLLGFVTYFVMPVMNLIFYIVLDQILLGF